MIVTPLKSVGRLTIFMRPDTREKWLSKYFVAIDTPEQKSRILEDFKCYKAALKWAQQQAEGQSTI